jgi:hypothetical protein
MDITLKDANGETKLDNFFVDEPCVVSFFIGELGWLVQRWQSYLRHLRHNVYKDHKFLMMLNGQYHTIIKDFVNWSIDLPKEFYDLNLETDCYEAPLPESPPGSLTPSEVWSNLIEFMRQFYNVEKAVEIWTPRGVNTWIDMQPQLFTKYVTEAIASASKPIVAVFPRGRSRAANRNVPEHVWYETVEILKQHYAVVLCGTPSGSYLVDYQATGVDNLIGKADLEQVLYLCPTHLSLLSMCPSYIIGHERERHTVADNKFEVPTSFRYVVDYRAIDAQTIINDINEFSNLLRQHGEFNTIERRLIKPVTRYTAHYSNRDVVGVVVGYQNPAMIGNTVNLLNMKKLYLVGKPSENEENLGNLTERLDEYNKADKIHWIATDINEGADEIKEELDFVYIEDLNISNEEVAKYFNKLKSGGAIGSGNLANWMKRGMPLPWRKAYCGVEHDVVHKFSDKATNTGWYTIKGGLLRDSMQRLKDGKNLVGVEIGVYFGENSKSILDNLDIKKLYLVDPYEEGLVGIKEKNAPQFIRNGAYSLLHSHSSKIEWIKKKSQDAVEDVPDNLDFVYIDGDHSYEGAKRDIELYWPKIKEGGILAGHDFDNENVAKAVKDYLEII